jgi:CBS domain-containing protein
MTIDHAMRVGDVMTRNPICMPEMTTVLEAARVMRDEEIGDVIVVNTDDHLKGIVTDRDVTVRAVAENRDPAETNLANICSEALTVLKPGDGIADAVRVMREHAVRRLPVVEGGTETPVGIISLGDLAVVRDPQSVLADISAAPANH